MTDFEDSGMIISSKGDLVYTEDTIGNPLLAVFGTLIRGSDDTVLATARKVPDEMLEDLLLLAFYARDIIEGDGERDLFYTLFMHVWDRRPDMCLKVVHLIPEYGAWFDLYRMFPSTDRSIPDMPHKMFRSHSLYNVNETRKDLVNKCVDVYVKSLIVDYYNAMHKKTVTLAGKWAPREGKHYHWFAKLIATNDTFRRVFPDMQDFSRYRKIVSKLSFAIQPVEIFMTESQGTTHFANIDFSRVSSLAMRKYKSAFMKEEGDDDRVTCAMNFRKYMEQVQEGRKKIKGSRIYPHQFVKDVLSNEDPEILSVVNAQWKDLVNNLKEKGSIKDSIVMADFSGSMSQMNNGVQCLHVCMGLAMLIAEVTSDEFRNKVITFDSNPTMHTIPDSTLEDKIRSFYGVSQGLSTDFQKALGLVLDTMKENKTPIGGEPKNLIVLTDMGWDRASEDGEWESNLDAMRRRFREEGQSVWGEDTDGWKTPTIVIWNLSNMYENQFQHKSTAEGVCLISGWSSNMIRQFMEGCDMVEITTNPEKHMYSIIRGERYAPIIEALREG